MALTAAHLCDMLHRSAHEVRSLRSYIDGLDARAGRDCDTGTNAALTLDAMYRSIKREISQAAPFRTALDAAVRGGVREGVGHIGIILTMLLHSWATTIGDHDDVSPLLFRTMLQTPPWESEDSAFAPAPSLISVFTEAASELDTLGDALPDIPQIMTIFAGQANYGLVISATDTDPDLDAGGVTLAVIFASCDAALRGENDMLTSLIQMLTDLVRDPEQPDERSPRGQTERSFTVDIILEGSSEDLYHHRGLLEALGVSYSCVGIRDIFGMGEWRLHIDTPAPLSVRPRAGAIIRFEVRDARPDELIGVDPLSDGTASTSGFHLLERPMVKRVDRASVIACTRAPGLVEDLAQAGAVVLLDPRPDDSRVFTTHIFRSATRASLLVPCDEESRGIASRVVCRIGEDGAAVDSADKETSTYVVNIADSHDDLSALAVVRACATLFVPRPGDATVQGIMSSMLVEAAHHALVRSEVRPLPTGGNENALGALIRDLLGSGPSRLRLLLAADVDSPFQVALLRQILSTEIDVSRPRLELEVIDGGQPGPSLLQGVR